MGSNRADTNKRVTPRTENRDFRICQVQEKMNSPLRQESGQKIETGNDAANGR